MAYVIDFIKQYHKICSIELNNSDCSDIIGIILDYNETYLEIQSINQYGEHDGKIICTLEDITHISFNDKYNLKLEILCKLNN